MLPVARVTLEDLIAPGTFYLMWEVACPKSLRHKIKNKSPK